MIPLPDTGTLLTENWNYRSHIYIDIFIISNSGCIRPVDGEARYIVCR